MNIIKGKIMSKEIQNYKKDEQGEIVKIDVMSKGPLLVKGKFKVTDHNGNVLETKDKVALCRCGASENKPFCDGAHKKIDFVN